MKSIEEYITKISSKYKLPDKYGFRTLDEFCDINNIDINNITEEQVNFYYTWNWNSLYNRNREQYYLNIYETFFCEPIYTENVTNMILKNGGYIYHITSKDNWKYIQKTGLRPRIGKTIKHNGYRYFPKRVFFIGNDTTNELTLQSILNVINDKKYNINDIILLKIDINNHNIGLFKDTASNDKNAIYTYESIPKEIIKKINIKNIDNIQL